MADGKVPVCTAGGAPVTKQYIYSLYDAKTGALRAKGTPQELMEQGYYNRAESVCTGYAHQKKKKAKPKKWRLEREEKQPKPKAEPDHRTGTQMREVWFYSMFDADGNLLHEGTATEMVEKGLFKNTQTVTNVFYAGHCRPQGIYSLTRKRYGGVCCAMRREPELVCRKRAGRRSRELRSRTSCSVLCMSCAFTTLRPGKQAKKS